MKTPRRPAGRPRPATPVLDAWQRRVRTGSGGAALGSPLWRAAAWEQSALNAWADHLSPATVAADLVEPYRQYAEALTHVSYGLADRLSDRELAMLEQVRHAPALSVAVRLAVLKLAEREGVDVHRYTAYERRHPWRSALFARQRGAA